MEKKFQIRFSGPATYRIKIQGKLEKSISDILGGMVVTTITESDNYYVTILEGPIQDQAELSGILESLYEWHLPLLDVECIS